MAARRDMLGTLLTAVRGPGLRPGGHRSLRVRADPRPLRRDRQWGAPGRAARRRAPPRNCRQSGAPIAGRPCAGRPLLQPRRRHQPRRRSRLHLPFHPHLAVRRRGNRPAARRAPHAHPRARPPVAASTSASSGRSIEIEGDQRSITAAREALEEGSAQARRRAAPLARVLRRPGGCAAGRARRRRRPGQHDPRPRRPASAGARPAVRARRAPRRSPSLGDDAAARLTLSYGLALEE